MMQGLLQTLRIVPCAVHRPHFIEPYLLQTRQLLQRGEFASVDDRLAKLSDETYEHLLWRLCRDRQLGRWLAAWSVARPQSPHAALVSAYKDICDAWAVRGEGYASAIPLLRRRRFPKIMAKAFGKFSRIVEQDPGNAMALAGLVHCNVVTGIGEGQRDAWLDQALASNGFHSPTIRQYARGTWPRWGGEGDEHLRFAGWIAERAPAGSCAHVVAAQAILDDAFTVSEEIFDIRRIARHVGNEAAATWIRRILLKWAEATPATLPMRLAEIAGRKADGYHGICLEAFALAAYFAGANEEARLLLQSLGGRLQSDIWDDFIPPRPMWLYVIGSRRRGARRVHDRVCRSLGLDPRLVCQ